MFYVVPFIIYYYYFFISCIVYICIFQNEDGKDNKKKYVYIFILIYFFICRNKNTRIKILSNDIVFVYP